MTEDIMNEIENHMVLPYADDDPISEPQEQDPDEAYEAYRTALSAKAYEDLHTEILRIARLAKGEQN